MRMAMPMKTLPLLMDFNPEDDAKKPSEVSYRLLPGATTFNLCLGVSHKILNLLRCETCAFSFSINILSHSSSLSSVTAGHRCCYRGETADGSHAGMSQPSSSSDDSTVATVYHCSRYKRCNVSCRTPSCRSSMRPSWPTCRA